MTNRLEVCLWKLAGAAVAAALAASSACGGSNAGNTEADARVAGGDGDGDGVPDELDACPGHDDRLDSDGDTVPDGCDQPGDWVTTATVGGLSMWYEVTNQELIAALDALKAQNVTVVEGDSQLSNYLSDDIFDDEMVLLTRVSRLAHQRDMKVVWYYPALESVTKDGRILTSSMGRDNPDWLQISIDGQPNLFYGDIAFWVDPDDESAWLDPLTGYRQYFLDRIRKMAATEVDGIWVDVPLLNDIVGVWTSHTPEAKARFLQDTGNEIPIEADASDPVWWQWIEWRHHIIAEFLVDVYQAAREVNPTIRIIIENVTMDYNSALIQGLDGAYVPELDGLSYVWEVDVTSESDSMIFASTEDWISLITMMKFGRGVTPNGPSWAFSYGNVEDDAELVMAEALAAQNNPYELKAPEMTTTVSPAYRQRVFGWIQEHHQDLFLSRSAARVAVLHSSSSRDLVDGTCMLQGQCGVALYASVDRPGGLREEATWWAYSPSESLHATSYLADYKGLVKALVHLHQPYDIVPIRKATGELLGQYAAVIVPDPQSVTDEEIARIGAYVQAGGQVLVTGPAPGTHTSAGARRPTGAFIDLLDGGTPRGSCRTRPHGPGSVTYCNLRPGKRYFDDNDAPSLDTIESFIRAAGAVIVDTDAPANVHFQMYRRGHRRILHMVNFTGVGDYEIPGIGDKVTVEPKRFRVTLDTRDIPSVSRVVATSARTGSEELAFTREDGMLRVEVDVMANLLLLIEP